MKLKIANASTTLFEGEVSSVTLPGESGEFEIRKDHSPVISTLKPGTIVAHPEPKGPPAVIYVESGIAYIEGNFVAVISDCAHIARDENEAALKETLRKQRETLHGKAASIDYQSLLNQLATTNALLSSIQKLRKYRKKI